MLNKLLPALLLASSLGAQSAAGQAPVYRLLYSPQASGVVGGQPTIMFEGEPGLFYILSFLADNVHGASIVTITSDGKFNTVYSFGPEVEILSLAQSTNRELYGP